jgi:deazaflavin-dependent oxidoreductase (nitroreductase family)
MTTDRMRIGPKQATETQVNATVAGFARKLARSADRLIIRMYRASRGRLPARVKGVPLLLLTTTGARTGLPRTKPVGYVHDGALLLIVGTNGGQDRTPSWCSNLRAEPSARVEIGSDTVEVRCTELTTEGRDRRWAMMTDRHPPLLAYQRKTDRIFPIFAVEQLPGSGALGYGAPTFAGDRTQCRVPRPEFPARGSVNEIAGRASPIRSGPVP